MFQHTATRRRLESGTFAPAGRGRFNTQPPEGGWITLFKPDTNIKFQHTATRRRLEVAKVFLRLSKPFQHTATRRRLGYFYKAFYLLGDVSTHSHPKAAGSVVPAARQRLRGFNTQPPEGGWSCNAPFSSNSGVRGFNTQPPEGGWTPPSPALPKPPCFNTQPPEGGWRLPSASASK